MLVPLATPSDAREPARAAGPPAIRQLRTVPLVITTADGRRHRYLVEVAETPEQQQRGLMFRTSLGPGRGMIFPRVPPSPASFWMKNTLIPLDMVFIAPDGRVESIIAEAEPLTLEPRSSLGPVAAVLELAGGEAARIGLRPGDRVAYDLASRSGS